MIPARTAPNRLALSPSAKRPRGRFGMVRGHVIPTLSSHRRAFRTLSTVLRANGGLPLPLHARAAQRQRLAPPGIAVEGIAARLTRLGGSRRPSALHPLSRPARRCT
jgi:hypothetical protein